MEQHVSPLALSGCSARDSSGDCIPILPTPVVRGTRGASNETNATHTCNRTSHQRKGSVAVDTQWKHNRRPTAKEVAVGHTRMPPSLLVAPHTRPGGPQHICMYARRDRVLKQLLLCRRPLSPNSVVVALVRHASPPGAATERRRTGKRQTRMTKSAGAHETQSQHVGQGCHGNIDIAHRSGSMHVSSPNIRARTHTVLAPTCRGTALQCDQGQTWQPRQTVVDSHPRTRLLPTAPHVGRPTKEAGQTHAED